MAVATETKTRTLLDMLNNGEEIRKGMKFRKVKYFGNDKGYPPIGSVYEVKDSGKFMEYCGENMVLKNNSRGCLYIETIKWEAELESGERGTRFNTRAHCFELVEDDNYA